MMDFTNPIKFWIKSFGLRPWIQKVMGLKFWACLLCVLGVVNPSSLESVRPVAMSPVRKLPPPPPPGGSFKLMDKYVEVLKFRTAYVNIHDLATLRCKSA